MKLPNVGKIWENRKAILEGITNSVFKQEAVEAIAAERHSICESCPLFDATGEKCEVPGTQPCCGDCGCSLHFKVRSLSSGCPKDYWAPVLTEQEEADHDILKDEDDA